MSIIDFLHTNAIWINFRHVERYCGMKRGSIQKDRGVKKEYIDKLRECLVLYYSFPDEVAQKKESRKEKPKTIELDARGLFTLENGQRRAFTLERGKKYEIVCLG